MASAGLETRTEREKYIFFKFRLLVAPISGFSRFTWVIEIQIRVYFPNVLHIYVERVRKRPKVWDNTIPINMRKIPIDQERKKRKKMYIESL